MNGMVLGTMPVSTINSHVPKRPASSSWAKFLRRRVLTYFLVGH
jgi:hypothetical protein